MRAPALEASARYYEDFAGQGDFASVPMAADLRFRGPLHTYLGGARYRRDCVELAARLRGLTIRHQFVEGNQVHTVYDVDLGLPSGPIASSETLTFDGGVLIAADLVIDSTPLRAPMSRPDEGR